LFLNFISCLNVRSSRLCIIVSTNWQSLILIWMAWTINNYSLIFICSCTDYAYECQINLFITYIIFQQKMEL
jgi:hypothetical protein